MRDSVIASAEPRAPGRPRRPRRPSRPRRQHRTPSTSPAPAPSPPAARGASPFLASAASGDKQRRGIRASEGEGEGRCLESQSSEPWPFNSKSLLEDKELLEAAAEEDEEEEREEGQGGRAGPSVVQRLARTTRDPSIRMQCRVVASLQPFSSAATIFSEAGERSFVLLQERVRAVAQAHRDQAPFLPAMGNERADELLGIRRSSQRRPRTPDPLLLAARRPPRRHHTTGRAGAGPGAEEAEEKGRASPQKPLGGGAGGGGGGGGRRRRRRRPSRVARLHDATKEATAPGRLAGLGDWETSSPSPSPRRGSRARPKAKAKGKAKSPARAKGKGLGLLRPSASSECVRLQLVHRRHRHAPLAALR